MHLTLKADRDNAKEVVLNVRFQWLREILISTGADFSEIFIEDSEDSEDEELSILQKAKLRKVLDQNDIVVVDEHDGELLIYISGELIAKWGKPNYRLCYDRKEINPQKRWYIEIEIDCWSTFEGEQNE